jgi:hypothetical protein
LRNENAQCIEQIMEKNAQCIEQKYGKNAFCIEQIMDFIKKR